MMAGPPGRPIYRHSARAPKSSLIFMVVMVPLLLIAWGVVFIQNLSHPFIAGLGTGWSDPITYVLLLIGVVIVVFVIASPYLFVPTHFMVTTSGVQTPYSRFTRLIRGYLKFVDYSDIDRIFAQFMPGTMSPVGSKGPDTFHSIVLILRNGKRLEIPWAPAGAPQAPKHLKEFRDLYIRCPGEFKERWSDLPVLTPAQEKISKLIDAKGRDNVQTKEQIVIRILSGLDMLFICFSLVPIMVFEEGPLFIGGLVCIGLSICMFPVLIIKGTGLEKDVQRAKASRTILQAHAKGEKIGLVGPDARLELVKDFVSFEPISQENIEKALKSFEKHNPAKTRTFGIISAASFLAGIFGLAVFIEIVDGSLFAILVLALFIFLFVSAFVFLVLSISSGGNITLHTMYIETVFADEVRLGKDILPSGYRPPKWFFLRRGPQPVEDLQLEKLRKWTRFTNTQQMLVTMTLMTGGVVLMMAFLPFMLLFDLPIWFFSFTIVSEVVGFPLGLLFIMKTAYATQKLDKIAKWEKRSGRSFLPPDLRARWEKWDAFRTSS